jgi:hypothetical protein
MPIMQNKEGKEKDVEMTAAEASSTEISKENLVLNGKFRIQKARDAQKTMGGRASPCSKKPRAKRGRNSNEFGVD